MDDARAVTEQLDRSTTRSPSACVAPGCPCRDARIVSHRRAAFFAAVARQRGETADRQIEVDDAWRLPTEPH
jgi:hypothetical protein